ncbi:MAG: hypothetical protein MK212_17165 [Saprospiraceae bacterium]|nr:hypothetical protein [Saprospiraceae bacterium]
MQQFLVIFLSSFLLTACQEEPTKKPPTAKAVTPVKKEVKPVTTYAKYPIHFIKSSLELPDVFRPVNTESLRKIINDAHNQTPRRVQDAQHKLKVLDKGEGDKQSIILEDSSNFENDIFIDSYPFIDFHKHDANYYMAYLDKDISKGLAMQNPKTSMRRLEGKFFSNKQARIIQIKYKIEAPNFPNYYLTQYLLNFFIIQKVFSITLRSTDSNDFEESIKQLEAKL